MTHEQREEYIRRVKKSFQNDITNHSSKKKYSYSNNENYVSNEDSHRSFGFWKVRLLIAIILFVAIFSFYQNGSDENKVAFNKLNDMITKEIDTESIAAWFEE